MFAVEGTRQAGLGAATGNLAVQLPLIAGEFPEVGACYPGTINLLLDYPLLVLAPDHRTRPLAWHPNFAAGEVFDFLRIQLETPTGAESVPAWLYIPHGSPHRQNLRLHEVIAPKVNVAAGARCRVRIDRKAVQVPYEAWPVVVVV